MESHKSDSERLAVIETLLQEIKVSLIGDGETGRIPRLERRVGKLEYLWRWAAGAGAVLFIWIRTVLVK
jgi:hypothetical protein